MEQALFFYFFLQRIEVEKRSKKAREEGEKREQEQSKQSSFHMREGT